MPARFAVGIIVSACTSRHSWASGAAGSVVGQIGRIQACRVIGIAGGAEKCRFAPRVYTTTKFNPSPATIKTTASQRSRWLFPEGLPRLTTYLSNKL